MRVSITRPMPQEPIQALAELEVLSASLQSSNLPPGLSFELLLDFGQGRLTGQVPDQPGLYQLIYSLTDARQGVVGQLYVLITVGEPTTTPGPTGPACPEAQLLTWGYGEVKGGTLHFFTLRQMPPELLSQIQAAGAQEAELLSSGLPQGVEFTLDLESGTGLLQGYMPPRAAVYEVVYRLFDYPGGGADRDPLPGWARGIPYRPLPGLGLHDLPGRPQGRGYHHRLRPGPGRPRPDRHGRARC